MHPEPPSEAPPGARTVAVPPARLHRWLTGFINRHGEPDVEVQAEQIALHAPDGTSAWLRVPFPPLAKSSDGWLEDIVRHVQRDRRVLALLVRRGGHAVGVFEGSALVGSRVGRRYVQGTTKAGGWSQQRFARRRDNQAKAAFAAAADDAVDVLLPLASTSAALVTGGDRPAVAAVLADRRLAALLELPRAPDLAVPDPRKSVLLAIPEQFRTVTIQIQP